MGSVHALYEFCGNCVLNPLGCPSSGMSSLTVLKHFFLSFPKPHFPSRSERLVKEWSLCGARGKGGLGS